MNFLIFCLYYLICSCVLFLIGFIVIKIIYRHKSKTISKGLEKALEDYFNNYDNL